MPDDDYSSQCPRCGYIATSDVKAKKFRQANEILREAAREALSNAYQDARAMCDRLNAELDKVVAERDSLRLECARLKSELVKRGD
jgi:hypothetical protein